MGVKRLLLLLLLRECILTDILLVLPFILKNRSKRSSFLVVEYNFLFKYICSFVDESIILCYADDGESICDLIASSSRTFKCKVLKHNISVLRTPQSISNFVLILTPEMLEELAKRPKHFLHANVSYFQNTVLVYHESLDIQSNRVRRSLEYQCPDILKWRSYRTGDNNANFLQMCLEIFSLTNMQNLQVPMLVNFKLTPKRIWSVSIESQLVKHCI